MKKVITTALLATLLAGTAAEAFAQDAPRGRAGPRNEYQRGSDDRDYARSQAQTQNQSPAQRQAAPPAPRQPQPAPQAEPRRAGKGGVIYYGQNASPPPQARPAPQAPVAPRADVRPGGSRDWNRDRDGARDGDRDRDRDRDQRDWNDRRRDDGWRNDGRRDPYWNDSRRPRDRDRPSYDRHYYPPVYQVPYRYRSAPYRPPPGWYAYGWSFGDVLPYGWYAPQYRILDWWAYDLPMPPIGYEWVRVGDDALLVDTFTGRVVQVVYDLFW